MERRRSSSLERLIFCFITSVIGAGALFHSAGAQSVRPPGAIDMGPSIGATTEAAIGSLRTKIMARKAEGRRRIESGRATTTFTPSPEGTRLAVSGMVFNDPGDPKTVPDQIRYVTQQVARFHVRMKQYDLKPYDLADGYTMMHALFYEAYHGDKLPQNQLRDNRAELRRTILSDENYQGMSDAERQEIYDKFASSAVYAIECRERAAKTTNEAERKTLIELARRNATWSGLLKTK